MTDWSFFFFDNSFLPYLLPPFSLQGVFYHYDYHFNWGIIYLLYLMAKVFSFIIIITSACHDSSKAAPPAMGMWTKFWQRRHSLCTSRTKVNYSWIGLNSLIQNTWASVQQEAVQLKITKRPTTVVNYLGVFY